MNEEPLVGLRKPFVDCWIYLIQTWEMLDMLRNSLSYRNLSLQVVHHMEFDS